MEDLKLMIAKVVFIIWFTFFLLYRRIFNPMSREEAIIWTYALSVMLDNKADVQLVANQADTPMSAEEEEPE